MKYLKNERLNAIANEVVDIITDGHGVNAGCTVSSVSLRIDSKRNVYATAKLSVAAYFRSEQNDWRINQEADDASKLA